MTYKEAISLINSGRCLLFTGAGFSIGATNHKGDMRLAWQVANEMYELCGVSEMEKDGILMSAADWFLKTKGIDQTIDYLNQEFNVEHVKDYHIALGGVNWKRCYTINYDNTIEKAYLQNGRTILPVTPSSNYDDYAKSSVCIHLNGSISNLNRQTINNEFKLTSISYAVDSITRTNWWSLFKSDLIVCDALFFVGCSLKWDIDVVRLINRLPDIKRRTFFIVSPDESDRNIALLQQYGTPIKIGTIGFANDIKAAPQTTSSTAIKNFKFFGVPNIRSTEPDRDFKHFVQLITEGQINDHLLDYSLLRPDYFPYVLYRDRVDTIKNKIQSGVKNFIVFSDLGNGKTIFLKSLSMKLQREGYHVFYLEKDLPGAIDEIEYISNTYGDNTIFIIENYGDHIDLLENFSLFRNTEHILILSERRTQYEVTQFLLKNISQDHFYEIALDELSDNEIDSLVTLVDKNYLWKEKSNLTFEEKANFIKVRCKRRLSQFILRLIRSNSDLKKRYIKVIDSIKSKQEFYLALLYIIINEIFGFDLQVSDIISDLDYDSLHTSDFNKNPSLNELVDFKENIITFKSSIFASYILREVLLDEDIKDSMVELFLILHEKRDQKRIRKQLKAMTKHSNLMKIFSERKNEDKGLLYFMRQIVDLEFNHTSPLFWLQYAIARLFDHDYKNAEICFANAYTYAQETPNYDTYQIDNHYARFLIEARIADYLQDEPLTLFLNAHNKLMVVKKGEEQRWYSFKVAENYIPFYKKFCNTFSSYEYKMFTDCCLAMIEKMEKFIRQDNAPEKDRVCRTIKELSYIVASPSQHL